MFVNRQGFYFLVKPFSKGVAGYMSLWNFVSSLIDVSLTNRTKSNLFMTTISEPLSGSEITMPSRFFCWSMLRPRHITRFWKEVS